ncbi:MAG: hypothetical protein M3N41_14400 [Acidobacteriota bacterium]|nr:hypothetical protein [Acidobacteriota bacterium]
MAHSAAHWVLTNTNVKTSRTLSLPLDTDIPKAIIASRDYSLGRFDPDYGAGQAQQEFDSLQFPTVAFLGIIATVWHTDGTIELQKWTT